MLASKTTEVKYVRKVRFISYPAGKYDHNTSYVCTSSSGPFVEQDGQFYAMYLEGTWLGTDKGITPAQDYAQNGTKATWRLMDKYKALIAEMVFADYAKLASAVFLGDYMFSQYGVSNGVQNSDYHLFNPDNLDAFRPNILIDWLKGYAEFKSGSFSGNVNASSGIFGDFKIDGLYLTSSHTYEHGCKVGDGFFESWSGRSSESNSVDASKYYLNMSANGHPITTALSWDEVQVHNHLSYHTIDFYIDVVGYYVSTGTPMPYGRRFYAFATDFGDIKTIAGRFQGHFAPTIQEVSSSEFTFGSSYLQKDAAIVITGNSVPDVYLPNTVARENPIIAGETYDIIICDAKSVKLRTSHGEKMVIKGAEYTAYSVDNIALKGEVQMIRAIWSGSKWYVILI